MYKIVGVNVGGIKKLGVWKSIIWNFGVIFVKCGKINVGNFGKL